MSAFYSQRGGAYTQDKTTYAGTWPKNAGGIIIAFYGNIYPACVHAQQG